MALTAFEMYLSLGGDDVAEIRREEVQKEIERLKGMMGYLEVEAPAGAEIYVDDVIQGIAPMDGVIPVAASVIHIVKVTTSNGQSLPERKVTLVSGTTTQLSFVETKEEVAATPVFEQAPVETGSEEEKPMPEEEKKERKKMTSLELAGWVTTGVGAATLIGSAVTGGLALSTGKDVDEKCPSGCYSDDYSLLDKRDNLALTTDVLIGVGATVAAAGVTIILFNFYKNKKERQDDQAFFILPSLNNRHIGASLELRF